MWRPLRKGIKPSIFQNAFFWPSGLLRDMKMLCYVGFSHFRIFNMVETLPKHKGWCDQICQNQPFSAASPTKRYKTHRHADLPSQRCVNAPANHRRASPPLSSPTSGRESTPSPSVIPTCIENYMKIAPFLTYYSSLLTLLIITH